MLLVTYTKHGGSKSYVYYNEPEPEILYLDYFDCKERNNPLTDSFEINKINQALDEYYKNNPK